MPHERMRSPNEPLAEDAQAISRSEIGNLVRIARIALPDAIYDASEAAQTFSGGGIIEVLERPGGNFRKWRKGSFAK